MKVSYIIAEKEKRGIGVYSISVDSTLKDVAVMLSKHNVGALLVTGEDQDSIGLISERDIIHYCSGDKLLEQIKISDIKLRDMIVVTEEDTLETARGIMARHHIRHLPVIIDRHIKGMITIRDIISVLEKQKDIQIKHLSDFVGGTYGNKVY